MRLNQKKKLLGLITTIDKIMGYVTNENGDRNKKLLKEGGEGLDVLFEVMSDHFEIRGLIQKVIDTIGVITSDEGNCVGLESDIGKIRKILNDVRMKLINDVKTEIEIVFMPYKASMWDSLDSIYREAESDPDCTCKVVPIPYYEKDARGQITRFCYEGNQLPKDIQTIPFELYELEKNQPDIIYIHNPYDQYNTLTMVNPRFFSDNLSKYTDMLVYVPYFIAGSSETSVMSILPAYKQVTKIIVQSDDQKNTFVVNGLEDNKVLNLGSPKIDAMHRAIKTRSEVPLYWSHIINGKKVFLFNTGIADLLSTSTWFEQIEQIINFFIAHEQYALIWRPHPLTEITIQTMRPNILEEYTQLQDKLKRATNIIVDNSNDIYQAVSVSDALISDYSSVMLQYIVTEKPVLGLINENMTESDRYYYGDYLGCYFTSHGMAVSQFVEMIENDCDIKREERVSRFNRSISNADGTSGQKIHRRIKEEVMQTIKA